MTTELNQKLLDAVINNQAGQVKSLLEQGANPNYYEDSALVRPLHFAAIYDCADVISSLITAGAEINAITDCAETALTIAKRHGSGKVLALLNTFCATTEDCLQ